MKYAVGFSVMAVGLIGWAFLQGGLAFALLWPAVSLGALAFGYAKIGGKVLGKRTSGTMPWWAVALFLPYLVPTWGLWHFLRMTLREDCCNEVASGLWLGRRPLAHEVPAGVDLIVDVAAELMEPAGVIAGRTYLSLAVLDGSVADLAAFASAVEKTSRWPGQAYIHCASGHGRSPTLMAAVLIRKGIAANVETALEQVRSARPGIGLNQQQMRFLKTWFQAMPEWERLRDE